MLEAESELPTASHTEKEHAQQIQEKQSFQLLALASPSWLHVVSLIPSQRRTTSSLNG